jgi:hypothetical protein
MVPRPDDLREAVQRLPRTPLFDAVRKLLEIQEKIVATAQNSVDLIIAGGVALHYWTRARVTTDIDAEFSRRLVITDEHVLYKDEQGHSQALSFDRGFSPTLATLHEDYLSRAVLVPEWGSGKINVFVLAPVDLAISKLGRFASNDRSDIRMLAACGLIDAEQFRVLAEEAFSYYVGDTSLLHKNLATAIADIERVPPGKPEK